MLFKDFLRAEMKRKGVSVIKMAEGLQTSRGYVYQLLNGDVKDPSLSRSLEICEILNISIDELVEKIKQGDSD
ncbi:DNA-binding helix-turn-helix protein [Atopobium deltae]|uniref:DNA-binding helix-turn-helix protein n=2 Tax=Atopobium deltae TaxID=1393034 RepID=A0A133XSP6_9ACTN|nr:DNA-binding helix-turn-helix protein [Atopobium deltae]